MHALIIACLAVGLALWAIPASAEDVEQLKRELEQMRRRFENSQQEYQKAIEAMRERLQRLEPAPQAVSTEPVPPRIQPGLAQTQPSTPPPAPPSPQITPMDVLRPREPFALYSQRGSGQLLFDIGVAGDFVGNLTQNNVEKAGGGTFPGLENRFFPREIELSLFGQIDPYARGEVRIEAGEESRGDEITVNLAEANFTLLTLPFGTQAKIGKMRNRFGLSNEVHEHDLPFIDRPDVMVSFLGDEGLTETGAEVTWIAPLPFYLQLLAGIFNGDNETSFGRGSLRDPLVTGRARTFFELTDTSALQLGVSVATGANTDDLRTTLVGFDVKYKYRPEGWLHPLVTLASEGIYSFRKVKVDVETDTDGDGVADTTVTDKRTRDRFGWYLYGEVQPWRRWSLGARYDNTQFPEDPGREWAFGPYVTFWPSEFLRFRLGYKHTERSGQTRDQFNLNGGSARTLDEILFQASFILGAHPAHPF
jgi:hypothetical protein